MKDTEKTKPSPLRLFPTEEESLRNEARKQFRTLAGYLRMLIITHPEVKSKKLIK